MQTQIDEQGKRSHNKVLFEDLRSQMPTMRIYAKIAAEYGISEDRVRQIIRSKTLPTPPLKGGNPKSSFKGDLEGLVRVRRRPRLLYKARVRSQTPPPLLKGGEGVRGRDGTLGFKPHSTTKRQ